MRSGRISAPRLARGYVAERTGLRSQRRSLPDRAVAIDADLSRDHAAILDASRARNANLRHDETEPPDPAVVRDMNEVVDLSARADHRVIDAAAIDRRVRADLDVV